MDLDQRKEQFSQAYAKAVSSVAGYSMMRPDVDDDSIDRSIAERGGGGTVHSPRVDVQLKCTSQSVFHGGALRFAIKIKNYNDLRVSNVLVPRILVLVVVPGDDPNGWVSHSEDELALRKCGYWVSLRGQPPTSNTGTITVSIPRTNVFDPSTLQAIMSRIGNGGLP